LSELRLTDAAGPLVRLVPAAVLTAAALSLATSHGSIAAIDWLGYAVLAALLLASVLVAGLAVSPGRLGLTSAFALIGLAAWTGLSSTWSAEPSLARDEALLTAFYAVVLLVSLLVFRWPNDRIGGTVVVVAGIVLLALVTAGRLAFGREPTDLYEAGRLFAPIGYWNAQSAFFAVAFWPAVALACVRTLPVLGRGLAVGGASSLLAGWLLIQSKGTAAGLAFSAILVFALAPARLRIFVPAVISAVVAAAAYDPLTEPYRIQRAAEAGFEESIRSAGRATLAVAAIAFLVGTVYALVDRRVNLSSRALRVSNAMALIAVCAAALAGLITFLVSVNPVSFFEDKWESFKGASATETGSSHLVNLGSDRYDLWRVALGEFVDHPVAGIGGRGFGSAYVLEGHADLTSTRAHSLPLDVLSETGLIGIVLLVVALGAPLLVLLRRAPSDLIAVGLLGAAAYWLVHAAGDWIWTTPAAALPFFLLLGIGASPAVRNPLPGKVAALGAVLAVALALVAFAPPWLSARLTAQAFEEQSHSGDELRWARRLDPLSVDPLVAESVLAPSASARIGPLRRAVEMEPRSGTLHYLLGKAYLEAGRRGAAGAELRRAAQLYPRDPAIRAALKRALAEP
jgi:hypothetical protein